MSTAGLRYYHPELKGWVTCVARRKTHILTNTGGVDKIRLIYRYECDEDGCGYTTTAVGITAVRKAADAHRYGLHKPVPVFPWNPGAAGQQPGQGEGRTPVPGEPPF